MTIKKIIKILNGKIINKVKFKNHQINELKIDSRNINKNDIFISLIGKRFNGHDYIKEAILNGACALIVEETVNINTKIPIIKVESTYNALLIIASFIRQNNNIPLIAITGSAGKTTTKELITKVLETKYNVLSSKNNNNNHIGLPLTLFKLKKGHQMIVLELGMNHLGEISILSKTCKPNMSIITNIGTSHIGFLNSKKNIFNAKMEIIDGMEDGILLVNGDDEYLKKIKNKKMKVIKCGINHYNEFNISNINTYIDKTTFNLKYNKKTYHITFNVPGKHLLNNVVLAIKTGLIYQIDINDIIKTINEYHSIDKRMNIIKQNNNIIIEDCYNSSYESLTGVLELIKEDKRKKILIIGDILELGKNSYKIHHNIYKKIRKIKNKEVYLVGNETKFMNKMYNHFNTTEELINELKNHNFTNSLILIKGSRKLQLEAVKESL